MDGCVGCNLGDMEGVRTKSWTDRWSKEEVRMHSRDDVELFRLALEEGMSVADAAAAVGATRRTGYRWLSGMMPWGPEGREAEARARAESERRSAVRRRLDGDERAAYDAAMEENVLLRAVLADLKAEGCAPASMSNARKCALGERLRRETGLPLRSITAFLRASKSSYEYHRARLGRRRDRDADIRAEVRRLFEASGRSRGYREVWARLRAGGVRASEKRVLRVMRGEGLRPAYAKRRRRGHGSYAGEVSAAPPNLVGRRFRAGEPDRLWLTDITEFRLPSGDKACLSPVVDCFDGKPVAWSVGPRPTAELANSSLLKALARRPDGAGPTVVHSDRGGHYRWPGWVAICEEGGLVRSMSAKGCSPDSAACEGFFGRLKNEFFHYRYWSGVSPAEFSRRLEAYLRYYCEDRLKESLGWMSPNGYRRSLGYSV